MPTVKFTERKTVQNPLLKYAVEVGWEYIECDKALDLRDGETGVLFKETLKGKLFTLNDWMEEDIADEIVKDLEQRIRTDITGNQQILDYLRGSVPFYSRAEKRGMDVKFIDFEKPENNIFQVADELTFTNGKAWSRFDLVFYINGIPIVVAETKNPEKEEGIPEALGHVRRYQREIPEFMVFPLFYIASNLLEFRYGSTWNVEERYLYHWRGGENFEQIVKSFCDKERILSLIKDYIIFWEERGEIKKIILNFHQIRAVEKIVKRVLEKKKKHGLIWHTQGSGKSLTMIVAAHKLRKIQELENPTLIMVVDRTELEEQMGRNLENYGFEVVEVAKSKRHLQALLQKDFRGLIVTTIQKFERMPEKINERKNIVVFVDEAHRTQEGELGVYLRAALPNAFYFGFTGTPIDKTNVGKGTFLMFGKEDQPQGYLDKYSILDSLQDGTTVQLHYAFAPNKLLAPTDVLEQEFFKLIEKEGVASVEDLDKKVLEKAVKLKNLLKSNDRVKKVAEFVTRHFKENVEPMGFKALLVGVDREACALLKKEIDKHLPKDCSQVVYTRDYKDPEFMKKYYLEEKEEREIKKRFLKVEEMPKILIVTSKLLTGFDAPLLYVMYLDKPMSDHSLLQAIARVNRPFSGRETNNPKPAGLIVDFVGIFEKLQRALRFDSATIEGVVIDLAKIKKEFINLIKKGKDYIKIVGGKIDDKAVERVVDYFYKDRNKRKEFIEFYFSLQKNYEILAPDPFLRPYLDDYLILSGIFNIIKANIRKKIPEALWKKTSRLIREKAETKGLKTTLPVYPIDERAIKVIHEDASPERVKIIKTHRSIQIFIDTEGPKQPFLFSLKEKLEKILEEFEQRQSTTKETLQRLEDLIKEINTAKTEKRKLGLNEEQFGIYWTIQDAVQDKEKGRDTALQIDKLMKEYSSWIYNATIARKLRAKIIASFLPLFRSSEESVRKMEQVLDLERQIHRIVKER